VVALSDDVAPLPEHRPLSKEEAEQVVLKATGGVEEGMSKWNTGYHWEERNLTAWAEQRLTELCTTECLVQMKNWRCEVTSVKNEGHVSSALRKGQKLIGYELAIEMGWEGRISDASGDFCVTGRVQIPCLTEDQDLKETEIKIVDDDIKVESAPIVDKEVAELATHEISRGDAATLEAAQVPMEVVHKKRELLAKIMKSKGLKRLKEILKQFIHDIYEK